MSPVTAKEDKGKAVLAIYIRSKKRHYKHSTILTRQSAVLAVNMMHGHGPSNKVCPHGKKVTKVVVKLDHYYIKQFFMIKIFIISL